MTRADWITTVAYLPLAAFVGLAIGESRMVLTERRVLPTIQTSPTSTPRRAGATSIEETARAAASLCGVDPDLYWSLVLRESSGRHWDRRGRVLRSASNAYGLGQIKIATAKDVSPDLDIMQPWGNALASACHLRKLLDRFDQRTALHAYHAGEGAVRRGQITQQTRDYARDIEARQ